MIVIYFYLRSLAQTWPAAKAAPGLLWGTINLALILLSAIPFIASDRAALDLKLRKVRIWMVVGSVVSLALCGVRWMEFTALNVRWDEGAYGSVVWMLMGLHTFNLVTDIGDTLVLTVLMFKGPLEGKHFVDIAENAGYWNFVVLSWIPIYAVVYWGARF
jgi:heme/copper-type cytochrome/quinol oxidase subunit 3